MMKTIVFDLGGVYYKGGTKVALPKIYKLVTVRKEKVDEIFAGFPHKEGFLYRKGKLTKKQFWQKAVEKLKIDKRMVPNLQEIWHSSYRPLQGVKEIASRLRKNYKVIVFSGTVKERVEYLNEKYNLERDFDDFIFSFDIGFNKGEPESYQVLLERIGCQPQECVFVDNNQEFLNLAKPFGLKTVLFQNPEQLKSDLRKFGVLI